MGMNRCLLTVAAVFACLGANAATWFNWKGSAYLQVRTPVGMMLLLR